MTHSKPYFGREMVVFVFGKREGGGGLDPPLMRILSHSAVGCLFYLAFGQRQISNTDTKLYALNHDI